MVNPIERKINPLQLCVHGISVAVHSNNQIWLERIARDFAFFSDDTGRTPDILIHVAIQTPVRDSLPDQPATQVFSECVVYETKKKTRVVDYHGQALLHDYGSQGHLETADPDLAHELAFLYLLSKIGSRLDAQGIHRVHALGFEKNGAATIVLIPSGGGKSTLACALLQKAEAHGVSLLSDDTPLIDRKGNAIPFPLRLAYRKDFPLPAAWEKNIEILKRRKYGEKKLIPISALPITAQPKRNQRFPIKTVILAERHGSRPTPRVVLASKRQLLTALNRDMVVGLGLPQVAELILRKGLFSLAQLIPTASSRFILANRLALSVKGYRLQMTENAQLNANAIMELI